MRSPNCESNTTWKFGLKISNPKFHIKLFPFFFQVQWCHIFRKMLKTLRCKLVWALSFGVKWKTSTIIRYLKVFFSLLDIQSTVRRHSGKLNLTVLSTHYHLPVQANQKKIVQKNDAIFSIYGKNGVIPWHFFWILTYRIVASRSTSRLVTCLGLFRLLMKGIFGPYVLWPLDKKLIFWIVTSVSARDYTVSFFYIQRGILMSTPYDGWWR